MTGQNLLRSTLLAATILMPGALSAQAQSQPSSLDLALTLVWSARSDGAADRATIGVPVPQSLQISDALFQEKASRKSPGLAAGLSLIIPGTGQMYLGKWGWGALYFALNVVTGYNAMYTGEPLGYTAWALVDLWIVADAYMGAVKHNRDNGLSFSQPQLAPRLGAASGFNGATDARINITLARFAM